MLETSTMLKFGKKKCSKSSFCPNNNSGKNTGIMEQTIVYSVFELAKFQKGSYEHVTFVEIICTFSSECPAVNQEWMLELSTGNLIRVFEGGIRVQAVQELVTLIFWT